MGAYTEIQMKYKEALAVRQAELHTLLMEELGTQYRSIYQLGKEIGVAWITLKKFIGNKHPTNPRVLNKIEKWLNRQECKTS